LLEFERAHDRDATVETVHMPSLYSNDDADDRIDIRSSRTSIAGADEKRDDEGGASESRSKETDAGEVRGAREARGARRGATLCVSTQVGCPVGCPFCASGLLGLARNLAAHEILEQFVRGRAIGPLARSVVMGMGEPLLNYENLSRALDAVHDEMKLGSRKVTVSTVGFPERLRKIAPTKPRFQLAISLHTPDQEQRDELVPAMKGVSIEDVLAAGDDWFEKTGREVTYEYILLGGENDTPGHARRLADRLRGRRCTVNLIPFNPVSESPYRRPSSSAVATFRDTLTAARIVATVRWSRGIESDAACGQLRIRHVAPNAGAERFNSPSSE
jgi:23S rRNA (adenine2503-C2)-methyltransferase